MKEENKKRIYLEGKITEEPLSHVNSMSLCPVPLSCQPNFVCNANNLPVDALCEQFQNQPDLPPPGEILRSEPSLQSDHLGSPSASDMPSSDYITADDTTGLPLTPSFQTIHPDQANNDFTLPDISLSPPNTDPRPADMNKMNIMLTNARSLSPKIGSLIDFFSEMEITVGMISESWLKDGKDLDKDLHDLEMGTSLKIIYKNRASKSRKISRYNESPARGGGVAVVFDSTKIKLTEYKIQGNKYEIVASSGKLFGSSREFFFIAIYIPPKTRVSTYTTIIELLTDLISNIKVKHEDAAIFLGGDMNRRDFSLITRAFPDITTLQTNPTRHGIHLDLIATNLNDALSVCSIHPPLETDDGLLKSDHSIVYASYLISKRTRPKWTTHLAREKTDEGKALFHELLKEQDWSLVTESNNPSEMACQLDYILTDK